MIGIKLQNIRINNTELCVQSVISNIQSFKRRKIHDKSIHQHLHKLLPRCLYHSSQHSLIERRNNSNGNISHCVSTNKQLYCQHLLVGRNFGMLQTSFKNHPVCHQSKRFFGDSATGIPAVGSNAPIARYDTFVELLSSSPPVEFCQNSLLALHSSTGLPWWATIALVACTARTIVTLPSALYQQYIFAKISLLKYEMDDIVKDLKRETNAAVDIFGWSETYARTTYNRSLKKQWKKLIIRDNCHPMKGLVMMIIQFPLWVTLSASFRNLCFMQPRFSQTAYETFLQLSVEGFGWIGNLTAADNYWILPILLGAVHLTNIEIQALLRSKESTTIQKVIANVFRGISILMVPLAGIVPSGLSLYWVTSSAYGIVQSLIVVSPRVRRFVRIPETDSELKHPYRHLYNNFKDKYAWMNIRKIIENRSIN